MQHVPLRDVVNCFVASHPVFWTLLIKYSSDPLINMDGLYGLSTRLCVSMHERSLYVQTHDYRHTFSLEFTVPPGKLPILSTDNGSVFNVFKSCMNSVFPLCSVSAASNAAQHMHTHTPACIKTHV